jgi:hypothetical protein
MKAALLAWVVVFGGVIPAIAQGIPTEPVSFADGRVVFGAEVTGTFANADPGFFNYTDYENSALRNLRIGITAEVRASRTLQLLGEVRMDNDYLQPFALYARIRPWPDRRFDIHVGRIPTTFGAFGRGTYGSANLLIGSPLAYQYLTSLRTDALPASADELVRMRGRGWLSNFSLGNPAEDRGLPIINSFRWDTGLQVHGVNGIVEWTGAITTGSLSNPRVDDDNDGRQVAARAVLRPSAGVAVGASASRGAFLSRSLEDALTADQRLGDGVQQAVGMDIEYSIGRFLARSEVIRSRWTLPVALTSLEPEQLAATALLGEARYRLFPGVQVAARAERLSFDHMRTTSGSQRWEAPVNRFEVGTAYSITRNAIVKASWQRNTREGGRVRTATLGAAQVIYWF